MARIGMATPIEFGAQDPETASTIEVPGARVKHRGGKRFALALALVALGALAAAVWTFQDGFRELYYLAVLDSKDEAEVNRAIRRLGELRSSRAVPGILAAVLERPPGQSHDPEAVLRRLEDCGDALRTIRAAGLQGFLAALKSENSDVRFHAACWLSAPGPGAEAAFPFLLEAALRDGDRSVRMRSALAMLASAPARTLERLSRLKDRRQLEEVARITASLSEGGFNDRWAGFLLEALQDLEAARSP